MQNNPGYILQQGDTPAYHARETQAYLAGQQIGVIQPWPAVSSGTNPIDYVWDILGLHTQEMNPKLQNNVQLIQSLTSAWNALIQDQIFNIVNSTRRRCQAVIATSGGHTLY
ncbi:transposable element tcb1 transposase [Plakobranchus ocellatus]|uniref:Transposable element tcb1 transposase n=1 Tax=Plakobranchus ocellatus TaxID=259542 RepID=A0AAV3Y1J9_9GAST|nr:transposable element tcb1 transposase [Plakobranchus ocellatus]